MAQREKLPVAVAKEDEGKANRPGLSYGFGGGGVDVGPQQ